MLDNSLAARLRDYVDAAVPFRALAGGGDSPARELLERRIASFVDAMKSEYKLTVVLDRELREEMFERVSKIDDARRIDELVNEFLFSPMTEALLEGECDARVRLRWNASDGRAHVDADRVGRVTQPLGSQEANEEAPRCETDEDEDERVREAKGASEHS
jgi:ATP-dependent Clp protease ATP-binding subunit ClpA